MKCYDGEIKCPYCEETILTGGCNYMQNDPHHTSPIKNVCIGMKIPCPYCGETIKVIDMIMKVTLIENRMKYTENIDHIVVEYCVEYEDSTEKI